ncbi:hypothetical protein B7P43_G17193 [Cryptotermes secundus]|uniref:Uncharacterized protein n=1 Tax=Cryptotermes secundus TaxID=105785 RepID=A0A2J7QSR4_9NEOP|nr:hypothetical protein B7P43_G17193 [Cryptotermes secundus]
MVWIYGPVLFTLFSLPPLIHSGLQSCIPSLCNHDIFYFFLHSAYSFSTKIEAAYSSEMLVIIN